MKVTTDNYAPRQVKGGCAIFVALAHNGSLLCRAVWTTTQQHAPDQCTHRERERERETAGPWPTNS